ncbi:relaxase/mobilization nuclease domain-containing protein [Roseovarius sp. MMSF_3281]|uniref:relaxase/mobilization nuclease domain-containing protein n=1 Tax=Roseovarius sp. MMSF_3281 TaxID=3046694 RepID=UPI00273ED5E7|nr:hypothetical protein [Roseovarius sp. MMSF_3281]
MIINQTRIGSGGGRNVIAHVNKTEQNEVVRLVAGSEDDLMLDDELATQDGKKYGIRHFNISPTETLTPDQYRDLMQMLNKEFDFKDRSVAVYEHVKERPDGIKVPHYHILVSEQNQEGRTMSSSHNYARNEKIARIAEVKFGHQQVKGAHNRAVRDAAPDRAKSVFNDICDGPRPSTVFSKGVHQKAERHGVDLPQIAYEMTRLRENSNQEKGEALAKLAADHGVRIEKGDRKNVILLKDQDGELICSTHKALGIKAKDVTEVLAAKDRQAASHAENRDRHNVEENRQHRTNVRSDSTNQKLSVRSLGSDERASGRSRTARPDHNASRTTGTNLGEPNWPNRGTGTVSERSDGVNRSVQLNDRNISKQRLTSAATRSAANKSNSRMKFGNQTSSQFLSAISSSPEPSSIDNDDPLYAEKVLDAWRRSMQPNGPSGP